MSFRERKKMGDIDGAPGGRLPGKLQCTGPTFPAFPPKA